MAKLLCHLLMKVNHVMIANFYVANMSFNAIRENKILAKISEFTVVRRLAALTRNAYSSFIVWPRVFIFGTLIAYDVVELHRRVQIRVKGQGHIIQ